MKNNRKDLLIVIPHNTPQCSVRSFGVDFYNKKNIYGVIIASLMLARVCIAYDVACRMKPTGIFHKKRVPCTLSNPRMVVVVARDGASPTPAI